MRDSSTSERQARRDIRRLAVKLAVAACVVAIAYFVFANGAGHRTSSDNAALAALGRQIFFDRQFSSDGKVNCASCHRPDLAFTDGRPLAIGVDGHAGTRNTPSLLASTGTDRTSFFWDGRRSDLKIAVLDPFTNPVEMGLSNKEQLLGKINASPSYKDLFRVAFGGSTTEVDPAQIAQALTSYLHTIDPHTTAFDRYVSGHDANALSPQAVMGMSIFSGKGQCATCHSLKETTFTDHAFHRTGVGLESVATELPELTTAMMQRSTQDDELGPWIATHPREAQLGRFNVTHQVADIETFATPSLRHVSLTAPYMHDGSVPTLEAAIDREIYYRSLDTGYPIGLTAQERKDLQSFLDAL
jgi:cytochrome c peroxidase